MIENNINTATNNLSLKNFFDFRSFVPAFKAEFFKTNHLNLLAITQLFTIIIVLLVYLGNTTVSHVGENIILSYNLLMKLHFGTFLLFGYPLILGTVITYQFKVEFSGNSKRNLYTLPINRSTIFFAKFVLTMAYLLLTLIVHSLLVLYLRQYYAELYGFNAQIPGETIEYLFWCSFLVFLCSMPIVAVHLWLSSLKLPQIWNILLLLGIIILSIILIEVNDIFSNPWFNFYLFPFVIVKQLFKVEYTFDISDLVAFDYYNINFIILMTLGISLLLFILIPYYINKKDEKY